MGDTTHSIVVSPFFQISSPTDNEPLNDSDETIAKFSNSRCNNESCSSQETPPLTPTSKVKTKTTFSPRYARRPGKKYAAAVKKPAHTKEVKSPYFASELDSSERIKQEEDPSRQRDTWIPPRSPYALIQEDLFANPWQLLIATIFLTKTRAQLAITPLLKFLDKWPTPENLLKANFDEIHEILQPLGLGALRSRTILRFTKEFLEKDWRYPIELYGIGKYGNDSYRMFCVNEWRDVTPTDIPLSKYKVWLTMNEERLGLK
nr:PREDICTED: methyl-CpG-binding domain protein 4-like [Bemisia tabaci]